MNLFNINSNTYKALRFVNLHIDDGIYPLNLLL